MIDIPEICLKAGIPRCKMTGSKKKKKKWITRSHPVELEKNLGNINNIGQGEKWYCSLEVYLGKDVYEKIVAYQP